MERVEIAWPHVCRCLGFVGRRKTREIVGNFVEVCRRGLKVNAVKSKMMVLNEEEGLEYKVSVDGV